ncbi:MAG: cytochrome P450 [Microthrixaceae bacterium]
MSTLVYNPYSFATHDDPYATYRAMRDEAPVYWNDELRFWALTRFDDVLEGFRDYGTYTSTKGIALEQRGRVNPKFRQLIELDPPEHTAIRKLVGRVFTGRQVANMEAATRRIVNGYLDEVIEAGHCDLVADFTGPFPMDVIAEVLGIPEADRPGLRAHADQILIREDGRMEMPAEAMDGMFALLNYFIEDLPRRRAGQGSGLISDLVNVEVDGRRLTDEELLGFCVLFVIAGHETTTKMVANAVELLDRHPPQRASVLEDPGLVPQLVEEVVRFHNSTQYMHRTLTRDVELHGVTMRADDSVLLMIGAANHDEREFGPTAEHFDIHRRPDRHLAFGYGAHFCLGAALARMEGRVALEEIHGRLGDYRVDHDAKVRFHSGNVTGWSRLPIDFTPGERVGR